MEWNIITQGQVGIDWCLDQHTKSLNSFTEWKTSDGKEHLLDDAIYRKLWTI